MSDKKYPEPTVGALVFNPDNDLFLMTSPKWHGKYIIPGGHIEIGETIIDALKREIKEETNLDIYDINFISVSDHSKDEEFHEPKHFIFLDHWCKTKDTNVKLNEEGSSYVWADIPEALKLPLADATRDLINSYIKLKNLNIK